MFTEKLRSQELWYAILVRMGRENSVKDQILEKEKELVPADLIVPEQPKNYLTDRDMTERYKDFSGYLDIISCNFIFYVNDLDKYEDILKWYLDINDGGTVHTEMELNRVKLLLEKEQNTQQIKKRHIDWLETQKY